MRKTRRLCKFPLRAGLLLLGSLAPSFAEAVDGGDSLSLSIVDGRVSIAAHDVSVYQVIAAIAEQGELRVIQHAVLDRRVSIDVRDEPLAAVLDEILENDSYQLFQRVANENESRKFDPVPGTLWIFSEGTSSAPAATVFFEAVLFYGSYSEKKEAIRELRRLGSPEAVQSLSLALNDEDARIRDVALEALAAIGSDEALAAIASTSTDTDPWMRAEAVNAISSTDSESAMQYLRTAMADPDPRVRMAVLDAFANIPNERAADAISLALQDPHPDVRMHALDALEEAEATIAFDALMKAHEQQ